MYNSTIYDYYDDGGILGNRTLLFQTKEMVVKTEPIGELSEKIIPRFFYCADFSIYTLLQMPFFVRYMLRSSQIILTD